MQPRAQAYDFEHLVLRDAALLDPLLFLWASRLPDAATKLQNIWRRCAGEEPGIPCDALSVHVEAHPPMCSVIVTLPPPVGFTECWFVIGLVSMPRKLIERINEEEPQVPAHDALDRALKVLLGTSTPEERVTWDVPALFFTLEHGLQADGTPRTVLCQWQRTDDGFNHVNHGDGPAPEREAFADAVQKLLRSMLAS